MAMQMERMTAEMARLMEFNLTLSGEVHRLRHEGTSSDGLAEVLRRQTEVLAELTVPKVVEKDETEVIKASVASLPLLVSPSSGDAAADCGDWFARICPTMQGLSKGSAEWWDLVQLKAKKEEEKR